MFFVRRLRMRGLTFPAQITLLRLPSMVGKPQGETKMGMKQRIKSKPGSDRYKEMRGRLVNEVKKGGV